MGRGDLGSSRWVQFSAIIGSMWKHALTIINIKRTNCFFKNNNNKTITKNTFGVNLTPSKVRAVLGQ